MNIMDLIRRCAGTFRDYERHHTAKGNLDGDSKARRNAELAELCEAAVATFSTRTPWTTEHCVRCGVEFIDLPEHLGSYGPRACAYPKHCPHRAPPEPPPEEA